MEKEGKEEDGEQRSIDGFWREERRHRRGDMKSKKRQKEENRAVNISAFI